MSRRSYFLNLPVFIKNLITSRPVVLIDDISCASSYFYIRVFRCTASAVCQSICRKASLSEIGNNFPEYFMVHGSIAVISDFYGICVCIKSNRGK